MAPRRLWPPRRLCRDPAPHGSGRGGAQPGAGRAGPLYEGPAPGHQRSLPCDGRRARDLRRPYRGPQQNHARCGGTPARQERRAPPQAGLRNGAPVRGPHRRHCQHRRAFLPAGIRPHRSRLRVSEIPRARRRDDEFVPRQADRRGRAPPLPPLSRARPQADRARAGAHRKARTSGLFSDRLGSGPVLPEQRNPGAGARLGRQQRRLLLAGDHGGGPGRHGPAVRAVPIRRARRVAGYRPRPAQWRSARARDSVRLPALRAARRGHDRQRHHLPRPLRRARGRQGSGFFRRRVGTPVLPRPRLGMEGPAIHRRAAVPRCRPRSL